MGKLRDLERGRGRISTEGLGNVLGANGLLRYVIQEKVLESGLELSRQLRKLLELTMLQRGGSVDLKLR